MNKKRQDVIRIITLLLLIETKVSIEQPFPDTESFTTNKDVKTTQNTTTVGNPQTDDGHYLDLLSGICREGWVKGRVNDVTVCLKTNPEPLSWSDARDTCRNDFSFLVKTEAPISIQSLHLQEYLRKQNIDDVWTGLHEEGGYLVWDEISPHKVRAYNDPLEEELLQRRSWRWNIVPDEDDDDIDENGDFEFQEESHSTCGSLNFNRQTDTHAISKRSILGILNQAKALQNDDALDTDHTPAPSSREVESPQDPRGQRMLESLQLQRWMTEQHKKQNAGRRTVHKAKEVKEYINSQRDRLLETNDNDQEFTTNLNKAIESVKPTEETDFAEQLRTNENFLNILSALSKHSNGLNNTSGRGVTPRPIPTTAASLVSVPTRPTKPVYIPLPTHPGNENLTATDQNGKATNLKLGLPIPTFKPREEKAKKDGKRKSETERRVHPDDVVDYEDLLLSEKKKSTQSNVLKPTRRTDFQKSAPVPTTQNKPKSMPPIPPVPSQKKKKLVKPVEPLKPTKVKIDKNIKQRNVTSNSDSTSSSEEQTDVNPIGIANSKSTILESEKEEQRNQILDSLSLSSENTDSTEDTNEIDGAEVTQLSQKQNKKAISPLPSKKLKSQVIPPAIGIIKENNRKTSSSSTVSDEKKSRVSETDEIFITDEMKSESLEKSKGKSEQKSKESKAKTPKPVPISIGQADTDDVKAYMEAMKLTTKKESSKETKDIKETPTKSSTLFNAKTFYDLTETSEETKIDTSKNNKNKKRKVKENKDKSKVDARGGLMLPSTLLDLDRNTEEDISSKHDKQQKTVESDSEETVNKVTNKVSTKNKAVAIPVMTAGDSDDSYINEYIKAIKSPTPKTTTTAKSVPKSKVTKTRKNEASEKKEVLFKSSDKSTSSDSKVEKEESSSHSQSSGSISFEDEEINRDRKQLLNQKTKKERKAIPPAIKVDKPETRTPITDQKGETGTKSSEILSEDKRIETSNKAGNIKKHTVNKDPSKVIVSNANQNRSPAENPPGSSVMEEESSDQNDKEVLSSSGISSDDEGNEIKDSATDIHNKQNDKPTAESKLASTQQDITNKTVLKDGDQSTEDNSLEITSTTAATVKIDSSRVKMNKPVNEKTSVERKNNAYTTTKSSLKVDSVISKSENKNLRNKIGGLIIPTQSNDIFGRLSDKINSNVAISANNDSVTDKPNVDVETAPISENSISVHSNIKMSDSESSEESSSEMSSGEVSASTESSILTSATRRDYGDDKDSPPVNRESEPDDAKLVIDRTDKNNTDSYSSDEESNESTSTRTVTIIPGVEDYVSTSASDEDSSEEIEATLPVSTLQLDSTQHPVKMDETKSSEDENNSVQLSTEKTREDKHSAEKSTNIDNANERSISKDSNVDKEIKKNKKNSNTGTKIVTSSKEETPASESGDNDAPDKGKSLKIKNHQDESGEINKPSDQNSKETNKLILTKNDNDTIAADSKQHLLDERTNNRIHGKSTEDISEVKTSKSNPDNDSSEEDINENDKKNRDYPMEKQDRENTEISERSPNASVSKENYNEVEKENPSEERLIEISIPTSLTPPDTSPVNDKSNQESAEMKSPENASLDESSEVTTPTTLSITHSSGSSTEGKERSQEDSTVESQENSHSDEQVDKVTLAPVPTPTTTKGSQESSENSDEVQGKNLSNELMETPTSSQNIDKPTQNIKEFDNDSNDSSTDDFTNAISSVKDKRKDNVTYTDSVDLSEEDLKMSPSSLPVIEVLDTNSGEIVDVYENDQFSKGNSTRGRLHSSEENLNEDDNNKSNSIEKKPLNIGGSKENKSEDSMDNSAKGNMTSDSEENITSIKLHHGENSRDDDSKEIRNESSDEDLNNTTIINDNISVPDEKNKLRISVKNLSTSSDSTEDYFGSSEKDNDKKLRFRNSDENKLMKSGNYELKDFYDHNNEVVDVPDDESMYKKEINRDKMERDKNFERESSSEIPIELVAIKNIDDDESTSVESDEAFRSLFEKLNNRSRSLIAEAASKDEIRHREDQDLDSAGIRAGEVSDDVDMDPEDILAQEADLKAEANVNAALLPNFANSQARMKTIKNDDRASMKLSHCHQRRTSVCYTYPITVESTASTCDSGWVGHVFHRKCYRIMRNANTIPKMPYKNAMSICKMEGGSIADLTDGFGGNFILMTLLKSIQERSKELPPKEEIPPVWVRRGAQDPSCNVMTVSGPIAMNCEKSIAVAVCEKNANDIGVQNTRNRNMSLDVKEFTINDKKILECDLQNSAKELPILWFKDGRLIDIKVRKRIRSILPHLGGRPIAPLPEPAETQVTSLELNTWLRKTLETSTDQSLSNEIFQGRYWCERWEINPFVREKSRETFVRFTDVITFVGKIRLPAIPYDERLLHNKIEKNLPPILSIMADLRFINEIVFRKLQQEFPNLERISAYPGEISSKPPLELTFNVYIRASKNYTTADEMPLYKSMRSRYQEILKDGNILTRLPRGTPLRFIRSLKIRSTVSCHQMTLKDPRTRLVANFFPAGINLNVSSIEVCENGERAGRATCKGDFQSGAYWGNVQIKRRCGTPDNLVEEPDEEFDERMDNEEEGEEFENLVQRMTPEERLKELAEMEIEENNLESVIEETAEIADTVEELQEADLEYINEIMEKSAISNGISRFVAAKALETVDRLLTMDDTVFQKAKRVSSIIKNFERIVEETEISDDGHFRLVLPNVAMEIYELEKHAQPIIGMAARTDENGKALYTPFNQQRIVSIYNDSAFYDDIDVAIHLPPELVQETKNENKSRLFMMVYRDGNMFQDSSALMNVDQAPLDSASLNRKRLNSFVISASIGGRKIEGLQQKVKTIFRPIKDVGNSPITCAFYDFTMNNMAGGWSSAGCVYDGQVNGRDVCLCDHLTNFAVLVDYYGQDDRVDRVHEVSLSIISLIGLSLSILGLSLTIISFVFFRKLRKGRAQQTLFNLALSMLCSWVIFLIGIKQTYHFIGCLIVAILLHYFILASFMWMLMEAFLQYLTFVKVLGTYVTRYTLKSVIAAWGLPLIPIICVLSVDHNLYKGGDHYCWMSVDAFYYAFALPVGVIILANLVIFIITVVSIFRRPQGLRSNQSKHKMAITNLQAAITSFVLLGLSWILGYFAISDARLPFQYAFTILNSLQGFFIFVLFVARKKQVREQWKMICCCIYPDQQKAQRTLSASASYPSTCSSRSTSSTSTLHHKGRTDRSDSCKTTTSFIGTEYDSIYTVPYSRASRDSLYYRKL
ncbi:uncharacterized protein LOC111107321 [Crassostrea virginica]